MMSVERSFEAWEEVQRHGQDLADKLAQGFTGLIQSTNINPPSFPWPNHPKPNIFDMEFLSSNFANMNFGLDNSRSNGVSAIFDIGNKLGQAGAQFGANLNGVAQNFLGRFPIPFQQDENNRVSSYGVPLRTEIINSQRSDSSITISEDLASLAARLKDYGFTEDELVTDESNDEEIEIFGVNLKTLKRFGKALGTINVTSTYDSRIQSVESSLIARGDLWRMEASNEHSTSGNENSSLFLMQLGPVLFVRDSTLLLPVNWSQQHLLWYGYDRKNKMHSLCPAIWSKHRRWLMMSMICLNPLACSFMDVQFPNGQITFMSGEGFSTSAYLPLFGGLLQAQGQYPGEMKFSFSCKNKYGTSITPMIQLPDKSFTMGLTQALAWKRTGLITKPTVKISLSPTIGGSNPGLRGEITHSIKEEINIACGCAFLRHASAFASIALGRSKMNGNIGNTGIVLKVETPLGNIGIPSFSVQLNSGFDL